MSTPKRPATRHFLKSLGAGAALGALGPALAQGKAPTEGVEYRAVKPSQAVDTPGKIEVLEFFWYGCPHCNALEPSLVDWARRLPADVVFRKVHVALGPHWQAHQQMYYTLDAMGRSAELNERIFLAIHNQGTLLDKPERMADFLARSGVDRKQFLDTYASFAVQTRMRRASQMAEVFGVDGVPALAVQGKWYTAPSMAGGNAQALRVVDFLIDRERRGGR
jgi:thiol:disulfide interchange protein DsbA